MKRKVVNLFLFIVLPFLFTIILFRYFSNTFDREYNNALELYSIGDYENAAEILDTLGSYRDSLELLQESRKSALELLVETKNEQLYEEAEMLYENGQLREASEIFRTLGEFRDSRDRATECELAINEKLITASWDRAIDLMNEHRYTEALEIFIELDSQYSFNGAREKADECRRLLLANTLSVGKAHTLALVDNNGQTEIRSTGVYIDNTTPALIPNLLSHQAELVSVSAGGVLSAGLTRDGRVIFDGYVLGTPIELHPDYQLFMGMNDIIQVAAGESFIAVLHSNGLVDVFGFNGNGQANTQNWKDITSIACSVVHTVGLKTDGTIVVAGNDVATQQEEIINRNVRTDNPIVFIDAFGGYNRTNFGMLADVHTVVLKRDGTIDIASNTTDTSLVEEVKKWEDVIRVSVGGHQESFYLSALRADGAITITEESDNSIFDSLSSEGVKFVVVDSGGGVTVGVDEKGNAVSAGYTLQGQREGIDTWTGILRFLH